MSRRQEEPLRAVTVEERCFLERLSRSQSQPAVQVAQAKALLMVADGHSYTVAAGAAGYRVGNTVAHLVSRFNVEGLKALELRHGGGMPASYGVVETERILAEVQRMSEHQGNGIVTWSLSQLKQALRQAPDGLPDVSTYTIRRVLHEAGYRWQKNRGWYEICQVKRRAGNGDGSRSSRDGKKPDWRGSIRPNPATILNGSKRLGGTTTQLPSNGAASARATTGIRWQWRLYSSAHPGSPNCPLTMAMGEANDPLADILPFL